MEEYEHSKRRRVRGELLGLLLVPQCAAASSRSTQACKMRLDEMFEVIMEAGQLRSGQGLNLGVSWRVFSRRSGSGQLGSFRRMGNLSLS